MQQVFNALIKAQVKKELPLAQPLVTSKDIYSPEAKAKLMRVYPPSAGGY